MECQLDSSSGVESHQNDTIKKVIINHCEYYPVLSKLICKEGTVRLNTKQAALLNYLIRHLGKECHKSAMIDCVWKSPASDKEKSFDQYLISLRRLLGDTRKPHDIIIKTSEQGCYRLTSDVTVEYEKKGRHVVGKVSAYTLVICLIAIILFMMPFQGEEMVNYKAIHYQPVTSLKGSIKNPVVSSDASLVVFSRQRQGESGSDLVAKRIGAEDYSVLVMSNGLDYHHEPHISPSGKQIAWIKNDYQANAQCRIMIATLHVLKSDIFISDKNALLDCSVAYYGRSPQWLDERRLLVSIPQGKNKPNGIVEIDIVTGEQSVITSPQGKGYGEYAMAIHPNVNKLAYLRQLSSNKAGADLRVYDFSTGEDKSIKNYRRFPFSITWLGDEIFTKGNEGFEMVSLAGKRSFVLSNRVESEHYPTAMGDNHIVVVSGEIKASDIQVVDLTTKKANDDISSIYHDYRAAIAKESEDITFLSLREGKRQIFMADKMDTVQITQFTQRKSFSDIAISPQGTLIATVEINNQLTIFNREGEEKYSKKLPLLAGVHFSAQGYLLYGVVKDSVSMIQQMSLTDFSVKSITTGFMPREDEQGNLYFFRLLEQSEHPVLYKRTPDGNITELFEVLFRLDNSNSYDVIHNILYYVERNGKQKTLVGRDLSTNDITDITPTTNTKFSLNKDATKLVTTKPGFVQNNLASFRVVKGELVGVEE